MDEDDIHIGLFDDFAPILINLLDAQLFAVFAPARFVLIGNRYNAHTGNLLQGFGAKFSMDVRPTDHAHAHFLFHWVSLLVSLTASADWLLSDRYAASTI